MSEKNFGPEIELRRRAEKQYRKQVKGESFSQTSGDLQRLVHELEVHQIELEMQNEELKQVRSDLESSLVQYTDLYDFAPVGYFTLSMNGVILQVNLPGATMFELGRSRLVNQNFFRFIAVESRPMFTAFLAKVFSDHSLETIEVKLRKEGGGMIHARLEARLSEDGQECRAALIDITAQKKAEDLLHESERRYTAVFENMTQGIMIYDRDGKVLSANPAAEFLLGLTLDQMQAKAPSDLHQQAEHEDGTYLTGETHPSMVALRTGKEVRKVVMKIKSKETGRFIWLMSSAVPLFMPGEDTPYQVFSTFEDISIIKRLEVYNKLTNREKEVFRLLGKRFGRKIIAEILNIQPKTVDKHRANLMEKLNMNEKEQLVGFAKLIGML